MTVESPNSLRPPGQDRNAAVTRRELENLHKEVSDFKRNTQSILIEILRLVDRSEDLHRNYPPTGITLTDLLRQIEEL